MRNPQVKLDFRPLSPTPDTLSRALEEFGHAREEWLQSRFGLQNGIPSHDTFRKDHGRIENGWHYTLDVAFGEDGSRVRKDHAPENFATLRRIALNLLKREKSLRVGVKNKRYKAAWDTRYPESVLAG